MGLFRWLFGPDAAARPPAWSTFDDDAAFGRFVEAVRARLVERDHEVEAHVVRTGSVMLRDGERRREWILHRLAEGCAALPEARWEETIASALDRFLSKVSSEEDFPEMVGKRRKRKKKRDAEDLALRTEPALTRADLRLQIFSSDYVRHLDQATSVRRPLAPGLEQVLVAVFAGSEITLAPADLDRMGLGEEEAWRLGSEMAIASDIEHVVTRELAVAGGGKLSLLVSNGFFTGACVLRALELQEEELALVTLLTWHHAVLYVPEGPPTLAALTQMTELVATLEREVAVSTAEWLSNAVLCYRRSDRSLSALAIARDDADHIVGVTPDVGLSIAEAESR